MIQLHDDAVADLRGIVAFGLANQLPDPHGFVAQLVGALGHLDTIKHPGRVGQVPGTREWVLTRLPYLAVFQKLPNGDTRVLRVKHTSQQWPQGAQNEAADAAS